MKKILYLFLVVLASISTKGQYLRGDFNSWGLSDSLSLYYGYYTTQFNTTDVITDCGFKVDQYGDWSLYWGYGTDSYQPVVNSYEGQMRGSNSGESPSNFTKTFEANKYYTFRLEGDETWWNRKFIIMETDAEPVEIISVSDNSSSVGTDSVSVNIELSSNLSAQEKVFVRYTTDSWSNYSIIECTGLGSNYIANIPGQTPGTNVEYYLLTSTMPLSFVSQYFDFATLRANNNAGLNYSYTVSSLDPYIEAVPQNTLYEPNLDGVQINLILHNDTWVDNNFDIANFTLNNAPQGFIIDNISYIDSENITLTFSFDGSDITEDINNFYITVSNIELNNSTGDLNSNELTILAYNPTEDFYMAKVSFWEGGTEDLFYTESEFDGHDFGNLNQNSSLYLKSGQAFVWKVPGGDIISSSMFYRIYHQGDTPSAFIQQDLLWHSENISNDTVYQLWWNAAPNETNLNVLEDLTQAGTYYIEIYFQAVNGNNDTIFRNNDGANYIARFNFENIPSLTASCPEPLNSTNLNGMQISLLLANETFDDNVLDVNNFSLNNAPDGLSVASVTWIDVDSAVLQLTYTGGLIFNQINNFSITISDLELSGDDPLESNNLIIYADEVHEGIYLAKISMWEGGQSDSWYDEVNFDNHDFGVFNSSMSLYFKSGQVFTWKDVQGDIVSAKMNYRIYKEGDEPGDFIIEDLPFFSEWISGTNTDQLWWNDSPDEIDLNLLEGAEEGTYFIEVYFEAENALGHTYYRNNNGNNYIAKYTYTINPVLIAQPEIQLTEENLNGAIINLSLVDDFFNDSNLEMSNFSLNNAPSGLEINEVNYVSPYNASITLSFDGTNFDSDIDDFSITIQGEELHLGITLTSNNITIQAIDESITIWTHLLTNENFSHYLGDNVYYWVNMEIGQPEWNLVQIGYGISFEDSESWYWSAAEWYEDGVDANKRVHALISVPQNIGTYYYAGRVRNTEAGQWFYANNETWSDTNVLAAQNTITVNALPSVQNFTATMLDGTRINLEWQSDYSFPNVMIVAKDSADFTGEIVQGHIYSLGEQFDGGAVIYKGNANSFIHSGLTNNTQYFYRIYTINNDYYSDFISLQAQTDDSEGCTFEVDLGEDVNICGASAVVLNSNLLVSPFGDSITIYFNSLEYPEFEEVTKIYFHAGVSLQGGNAWDYVVGNWGEDDGVGEMNQISENLWAITFNPLSYFGYNINSTLLGINCIFRNSDGTVVARVPITGEDFYIDMSLNPPQSNYSAVYVDYQSSPISQLMWSTGDNTAQISVSNSGTFWVSAIDNYGCIGLDTIVVNIFSLPYVEIGNDRTECVGAEIILNAGIFESYSWNNDSTTQTINVNESGIYSVTVTDNNGCSGFDQVNINFVEYPDADFSYEVINGTEVQFIDLSQFAENYEWDFDNDGSIDSNVGGNVSYTYPEIGQYSAKLMVSNACSSDSIIKSVLVLSVEDFEYAKGINIYPNPVYENIILTDINGRFEKLLMYDVLGKLVYEKEIKGINELEINISGFESGFYNILLINKEHSTSFKIIKK